MNACNGSAVVFLFALISGQIFASEPEQILSQADKLAELGNWDKARDLYAQAEQQFHVRGDTRNELYAKFGRLHRDVESGSYAAVLQQVEADLKNPVVENDSALKIRALALKGAIDLNVDTAGAEDDFAQLLAIAQSTGDQKWENRAAGELGIIAGVNGDLGRAAVTLQKAIAKAGALHDIGGQIYFTTWLANGMTVHGMADRALPLLDRALDTVKASPEAGFPVQLYIAKIRALIYLPDKTAALEKRAEAKQLLERALAYAKQNQILGAETELLNQAGLLAREEHANADAEKYFAEAADIAQRAALPRMRAEALLHLAELYEEMGQLSKAAHILETAIAEQSRVQEAYDLPLYIAKKADIEAALGHLRSADALYDRATYLVESMLVNSPSSRVKSSMIATMGDIYIGHFRLALTRFHNPAKAFGVLEAARGRALADSMRYSRGTPNTNSRSTSVEAEIAHLQRMMRQTSLSPADSKRLLARLDSAYDELVPVEYARNREQMKKLYRPVSLTRILASLQPGEALIEYVLDAERHSYALELTHRGVVVHTLPPREEIEKLVRAYVASVKEKNKSAPLARNLFDQVFAPALSTRPTSVTIVPDGSLHLLPFASLLDPDNRYAISSMTIASAPSATAFHILRTDDQTSKATKAFLGVAYSPDATSDVDREISAKRGVMDGRMPLSLPPLAYASQEVTTAGETLGKTSVILTGDNASEAALKAQPLSDFKIIHIAAHAVGNIMEPDRAALVLAPGNQTEDGFWQAREIRRSRFSADLVTLSACDTGVGRLQGEEGIMNLARSFLVAGAETVVASLWESDDRFTATLMGHFYKHIADGGTIAESLRAAQLDVLSQFGHDAQPYYWAGFTVIGDGTKTVILQADRTNVQAAR